VPADDREDLVHGLDLDIINAADRVLYDSKRAGRGRCMLAPANATPVGVAA
jgi:hypothetical protein